MVGGMLSRLKYVFFIYHQAAYGAKVASMIKGRTPDEIRKMFNISSDFTPEEEIMVGGMLSRLKSARLDFSHFKSL